MHFVVFGLCVSSSWGNGHATLWRGLLKALVRRGHTVTFYEKDVPYYASTRDGWQAPRGASVVLYEHFSDVRAEAKCECDRADVALFTSYCADAHEASRMLLDSAAAIKGFYDLDTPVTLECLHSGTRVPYLPPDGLGEFDLVLSYTGGRALAELQSLLGARVVKPLYGWVDESTHRPSAPLDEFRSELCYLGTFARDRQEMLDELFLKTAKALPERRFALAGAQYPDDFPWSQNIFFVRHLEPSLHPAFFCSSRATLNVTRAAMTQYGFCPSGRLFEAAACGVPIVSDVWEGLETFFTPGHEILPAVCSADVQAALGLSDYELKSIAAAARDKVLTCHTADTRVLELESICESVCGRTAQPEMIAHAG